MSNDNPAPCLLPFHPATERVDTWSCMSKSKHAQPVASRTPLVHTVPSSDFLTVLCLQCHEPVVTMLRAPTVTACDALTQGQAGAVLAEGQVMPVGAAHEAMFRGVAHLEANL